MSFLSPCFEPALAWAMRAGGEGDRPGFGLRMTPPGASDPFKDERNAGDARLVRLVAAGDRDALGGLYDRHARPLHATALRILNDPAEAQDVVHDAFITLWGKAAEFDPERGTVFGWAVTLVRNRAIDRLRTRRRRSEILGQAVPADLGYVESAGGGDDRAAQGDQAQAVRAAVATLPAEQQRALELAFFGGLTQQEIAERLREPLGTIKARIRRGLLKLREALAHRL